MKEGKRVGNEDERGKEGGEGRMKEGGEGRMKEGKRVGKGG